MNRMESEILEEKLDDLRKKLQQTIAQIQLLENQIRDFSNRKRRAHNQRKHSVNNRMKFRLVGSQQSAAGGCQATIYVFGSILLTKD